MDWVAQNSTFVNTLSGIVTAVATLVLAGFGVTAVLTYQRQQRKEDTKRIRVATAICRHLAELLHVAETIDASDTSNSLPVGRTARLTAFQDEFDSVMKQMERLWDDAAAEDYEAAAYLQIALDSGREVRRRANKLQIDMHDEDWGVGEQLIVEEPLSRVINAMSAAQARVAEEDEHDYIAHYREAQQLIDRSGERFEWADDLMTDAWERSASMSSGNMSDTENDKKRGV